MNISEYLKLYLITTATFLAIDFIWLGVIATKFYQHYLGYLLKSNPNFIAALVFYLLFTLGLIVFVISPAFSHNSLIRLVLTAALFGLITYATYDLTNLATIKNWPIQVVIVDMIWGIFLAVSTSVLSYKIFSLIK